MTRRPPRSTLFPLHDALPILSRRRSGRHLRNNPDRGNSRGTARRRADRRTYLRGVLGGSIAIESRSAEYFYRAVPVRSEEHTSELQSLRHLVCRLLLEKKKRL